MVKLLPGDSYLSESEKSDVIKFRSTYLQCCFLPISYAQSKKMLLCELTNSLDDFLSSFSVCRALFGGDLSGEGFKKIMNAWRVTGLVFAAEVAAQVNANTFSGVCCRG